LFPARKRALPALVISLGLLAAGLAGWSVYARQAPAASQRTAAIENEGAKLAATIAYPAGRGRFPGVVIVHGSGKLTRDVFVRDRDRLVAAGFAVLTYDKRGVGESTGEYDNVGVRTSPERMPLLGRDALACLRALGADRRVDPARLGFMGASQAGWIIPAAISAANPGEVRFAIILSGPATNVGLEYAYSEATGDGIRAHEALTREQIDARVDAYKGPPGFDHVPILALLKTPTLWLLGEEDESIPIRHTERNLRAAIASGAPITMRMYRGANHGLFAPSGPVAYWSDVLDWLRAQHILS
jgi:dienelactone hydrolase